MTTAQSIMPTSIFRPQFKSPEHYVEHCRQCEQLGRRWWPPKTHDEHVLLAKELPHIAKPYIDDDFAAQLGLPVCWYIPAEPYSEMECERLVETLRTNDEFRSIVRSLLGVA